MEEADEPNLDRIPDNIAEEPVANLSAIINAYLMTGEVEISPVAQ